MASPADPIRRARAGLLGTWVFGAPVVIGCAVWALRPFDDTPVSTAVPGAVAASVVYASPEPPPLDAAVFAAPAWNPPTPPPPSKPAPRKAVTRAPAPPPPPRLELVGIVVDADGARDAALYDPTTNKLRIVRAGDTLAGYTIDAVRDDVVELRRGTATVELRLKKEAVRR